MESKQVQTTRVCLQRKYTVQECQEKRLKNKQCLNMTQIQTHTHTFRKAKSLALSQENLQLGEGFLPSNEASPALRALRITRSCYFSLPEQRSTRQLPIVALNAIMVMRQILCNLVPTAQSPGLTRYR